MKIAKKKMLKIVQIRLRWHNWQKVVVVENTPNGHNKRNLLEMMPRKSKCGRIFKKKCQHRLASLIIRGAWHPPHLHKPTPFPKLNSREDQDKSNKAYALSTLWVDDAPEWQLCLGASGFHQRVNLGFGTS